MSNDSDKENIQAIPAEEVRLLDAPSFYASSVRLAWAGNDLTVIFSKPWPFYAKEEDGVKFGATSQEVAILHLSPSTAKDLLVVLQDVVGGYEEEWGEINTTFTSKRDKA